MESVLVIGAGPAGLLAAWTARQRGAQVKLLAAGIGMTHVSPGWVRVLGIGDTCTAPTAVRCKCWGLPGSSGDLNEALTSFVAIHPEHPYALAGLDALRGGIAALRAVGATAGLSFVGGDGLALPTANMLLPTALGATVQAALVPESFAAGDLRHLGPMLIAGPAGWRDFYPALCAENLARHGFAAQAASFDLPELRAGKFDATSVGLARLFDQAEVRGRVAAQLRPRLNGATRVGLPAVLGLTEAAAWRDLQERLGVAVFEIPILPPSVPGMRLFNAFKAALAHAGVQILLDMTATRGVSDEGPKGLARPLGPGVRMTGVVVPNVVRDQTYRADTIILATGGLYGGGITSDHHGELREAVFDLPLAAPAGGLTGWFDPQFLPSATAVETLVETLHATSLLTSHPIHTAGVRVNAAMQPVDADGRVLLDNVHIAGRLLGGYDPLAEGSTEGVSLATAYRAGLAGRA